MNYFHIIRKRLITLGVKPKDARQIAYDFDRQVLAKGVLSALRYFKDTGDTLIGYISGSRYKAPWVAVYDGYPRHWLVLKDYPMEVQLRCAKMARALLLRSPTPEMAEKLCKAAMSEYSGTQDGLHSLSSYQKLGLDYYSFGILPFKWEYTSVCKSARTYVSRSVPNGTEVGLDLQVVIQAYHAFSGLIHSLTNWQDVFYPISPSWIHGPTCPISGLSSFVGQVGGVMEQGGKLRIFAAPNVLLQNLLEPLQVWLDRYRELLPSDVFKDQETGAKWAQSKMQEGFEVQSIDLSSATCRYPLAPQLELLEYLGCPAEMLQFFVAVSRGTWQVQPHAQKWLKTPTFRWEVGQPLGIVPSMSAFALSHNLLLAGICVELGLDPKDSFRVLGDDVVCCNTLLATKYRQVITNCGISISEHKSYNSKRYAEFAGYSVLPTTMVRPGKWKAPSVLNVQGLVRDLGVDVIQEMKDEYHVTERLFAFRNGLYTPDVSEWNQYLLLNSTLFPNGLEIQYRKDGEYQWYDGCCKWLRKKFPGIYFATPTPHRLLDAIERSLTEEVYQQVHFDVKMSLFPFSQFGTETPWDVISTYVWIITNQPLGLTFSEMLDALAVLQREYEAYLWRIPVTDTKMSYRQHDAIHKLVLLTRS